MIFIFLFLSPKFSTIIIIFVNIRKQMFFKEVLRNKRHGCELRTHLRHQVCSHFCHDMPCDPGYACCFLGFLPVREGPHDDVWWLYNLWHAVTFHKSPYYVPAPRETRGSQENWHLQCSVTVGEGRVFERSGALNPLGRRRGRTKEGFLEEVEPELTRRRSKGWVGVGRERGTYHSLEIRDRAELSRESL